jgi:hypothetical protein
LDKRNAFDTEHNAFDLDNNAQLEICTGFHVRLAMNVGLCELYFQAQKNKYYLKIKG